MGESLPRIAKLSLINSSSKKYDRRSRKQSPLGIFHAAKAMLNVLGFDAKTHSGLISEFGLRIIKTNLLDKKFAEYFRRAFEMRESSDYEIGVIFGEEEVQTLLKNAEEFLKKAQEFHCEETLNLSVRCYFVNIRYIIAI